MSTIVVHRLLDALEHEPDEPDWLWRGYIARGWLSLLVGDPKSGKTTLICGLLDAFARRQPLLGGETTAAGVLILTEQARTVFKSTVRNFDLTLGADVHAMFYREQPALAWSDLIGQAVAACHERQLGLLVIDTWARWASLQRDHDATEILETMTPLGRALQSGLAVLIVHHSRKGGGSHGLEVSGRAELAASVDVILSLSRSGENRKLRGDGRSTQTPEEIVFGLGDGFELVTTEREAQAERVLAALRSGPLTYEEIMAATGIPRTSVLRFLDALMADGRARPAGKRGRARLFEASENELPNSPI